MTLKTDCALAEAVTAGDRLGLDEAAEQRELIRRRLYETPNTE